MKTDDGDSQDDFNLMWPKTQNEDIPWAKIFAAESKLEKVNEEVEFSEDILASLLSDSPTFKQKKTPSQELCS